MTITYGRSPEEIAEECLLEMTNPVFNLSRDDAKRLCVYRREIAESTRIEAEALVGEWAGTEENIRAAMHMWPAWEFVTSPYRVAA